MKGFGKYNLVCGIDFVEKSLPHCCFESADQQLDQRRPHPLDFARLRNDKMQTRDIYRISLLLDWYTFLATYRSPAPSSMRMLTGSPCNPSYTSVDSPHGMIVQLRGCFSHEIDLLDRRKIFCFNKQYSTSEIPEISGTSNFDYMQNRSRKVGDRFPWNEKINPSWKTISPKDFLSWGIEKISEPSKPPQRRKCLFSALEAK